MRGQTEPRKINRIEGVEGMLKALYDVPRKLDRGLR
jgi:hypothetical protein